MADWIVGGLLALLVIAIIRKMISDKCSGKGCSSCSGNCSHCGPACPHERS